MNLCRPRPAFYILTLFLNLFLVGHVYAQAPCKPTLALVEDSGTDTSDKTTNAIDENSNIQTSTESQVTGTPQDFADYLVEGYWIDDNKLSRRDFHINTAGTITYHISDLSDYYKGKALLALKFWSDATGLQFVEKSNSYEADLRFTDDGYGDFTNCDPNVGRYNNHCQINIESNFRDNPGEARIGPHFWENINDGLGFAYTLPDLALPTLAYGDTETLESDVEGVITLNLSNDGTGNISFVGNGNKTSVLDLGSVISSHEDIKIDSSTDMASITLPDTANSTLRFSNQRWLSYTTTDSENNSRRVGVYIGTNSGERVGDIFKYTNFLDDIHEIVVYGKNGSNTVFISINVPPDIDTAKFYGGSGNDSFTGIQNDVPTAMYGYGGKDTFYGYSNDMLFGGAGDDTLSANGSSNTNTNITYFGGEGADTMTGGDGNERLYGGDGNDQITSGGGRDVIYGGGGDDQLNLGDGVDILVFDGSGDGADQVLGVSTDGEQYFGNHDKLYFKNTTMTSRDKLSISATEINNIKVVSIAYTDASSVDNIKLLNVDFEDAHLVRRSNIVFEDDNDNVMVNVDDDTGTEPFFWPVITDENFNYSAITHSISGADAALFSIDATTGALSFNPALDANTLPTSDDGQEGTYQVTLTSTAGAMVVTKNLTIQINETQPPTLTSSPTASIDENIGAGQVVYTIAATDLNVGGIATYGIGGAVASENNVSYAIVGTDASHFTVDEKTGEVTLMADPDYETKSTYSFEARAFDAQLNIAKADVTLTINDVSDESTLSVEEISSNILMYNNPVRTSLHITSDEKLRQLRIFSINGRKVFEKELNTNSQNIDLSKLASGLYLLELATETQIKRGKLLKE